MRFSDGNESQTWLISSRHYILDVRAKETDGNGKDDEDTSRDFGAEKEDVHTLHASERTLTQAAKSIPGIFRAFLSKDPPATSGGFSSHRSVRS